MNKSFLINKMALKRKQTDINYKEGMAPPEGTKRGDYFFDRRGKKWGVVGRGDQARVVDAWKVPEYPKQKGKIDLSASEIGPSHPVGGPKGKHKVRRSREERLETGERIGNKRIKPNRIEGFTHKEIREANKPDTFGPKFNRWNRRPLVRYRGAIRGAMNVGIAGLIGYGAYRQVNRLINAHRRKQNALQSLYESDSPQYFMRNMGKSNKPIKDVAFVNDNGYYETYDSKGNIIEIEPNEYRKFLSGAQSLEKAAMSTLCKMINCGIINKESGVSHAESTSLRSGS